MFRKVPLSIIRSFSLSTQQWYMSYSLQLQLASRIRTEFRPDPARQLSANHYDIYHCCVYSEKTPDDGQRNCPKHVEFYSKNKFEKWVHLIGFHIRIYHDARSPERQILLQHFIKTARLTKMEKSYNHTPYQASKPAYRYVSFFWILPTYKEK